MMKKLFICGVGLIFIPLAFSQTSEQITITTYYPAPYGS